MIPKRTPASSWPKVSGRPPLTLHHRRFSSSGAVVSRSLHATKDGLLRQIAHLCCRCQVFTSAEGSSLQSWPSKDIWDGLNKACQQPGTVLGHGFVEALGENCRVSMWVPPGNRDHSLQGKLKKTDHPQTAKQPALSPLFFWSRTGLAICAVSTPPHSKDT